MSMDGKRFGVGVVAGLLVALAIVTASSGLGSFSGTFNLLAQVSPQAGGPLTTTTASNYSVTTIATIQTSTTSGSGPVLSSLNSTKSAFTTSTTNSNPYTLGSAAGGLTPIFSSRVDSIARQPLVSNAIILVPVLAAFIFGAVFYFASVRGRDHSSEE